MFNTYILFNVSNLIFIKIRDEETIGSMIQQNLYFWTLLILFISTEIGFTYYLPYGGFNGIEFNHWVWCIMFGLSNTVLNLIIGFTTIIMKIRKIK